MSNKFKYKIAEYVRLIPIDLIPLNVTKEYKTINKAYSIYYNDTFYPGTTPHILIDGDKYDSFLDKKFRINSRYYGLAGKPVYDLLSIDGTHSQVVYEEMIETYEKPIMLEENLFEI